MIEFGLSKKSKNQEENVLGPMKFYRKLVLLTLYLHHNWIYSVFIVGTLISRERSLVGPIFPYHTRQIMAQSKLGNLLFSLFGHKVPPSNFKLATSNRLFFSAAKFHPKVRCMPNISCQVEFCLSRLKTSRSQRSPQDWIKNQSVPLVIYRFLYPKE